MGTLDGRVAIVTGAGRGIGKAVAQLLASEGASVVVNDLGVELDGSGTNAGLAPDVVEEIVKAGGAAIANGSDVGDFDAAEALVKEALDVFERLDIVVNVAGILRDRMIFNMTEREWDDVIRVHLKGTFNVSRFAAIHWREKRDENAHNRIINFTSGSGLNGNPGQPNYAAAKMGIVGLTYSCANALGRLGVTTNAIAPSAATRMGASIPDHRRRKHAAAIQESRTAENIAPMIAYLASERSGWINGQVIHTLGHQYTLFNKPAPLCRIIGTETWEPDALADAVEQAFGSYLGYAP